MKIMIATDGTDCGLGAVKAIARLGLQSGDEVIIVSVIDMAPPFDFEGRAPSAGEDLESAFRNHAEKAVESAREIVSSFAGDTGARIRDEILFGSPAKRIVEAAEDWKVDLIIVGSHGYSKWQRILLGSVSDSVVHHAHCSVMIVRAGEFSEDTRGR